MMSSMTIHEAEQAVISDMLSAGVAERHALELNPTDFQDNLYQQAYTAIATLAARHQAVTIPALSEELDRTAGEMSADVFGAIMEARGRYAHTKGMMAADNIRIVKEQSIRRHAYNMLTDAAEQMQNPAADVNEVFEKVRAAMKALGNNDTSTDLMTLPEVLVVAYTQLNNLALGKDKPIATGITGLDERIAGLHRGEMTIIGARPAVGKSALAMQIAIGAATNGANVVVCSREMTAEQYGVRVLLRGSKGLESARLRKGQIDDDDWDELQASLNTYGKLTWARFTFKVKYVEDLRRLVEQQVNGNDGLDVLIVDYTQLMQTRQESEKEYVRIGIISKALKDIALDYNIAVVALAQVGRSSDNKMPNMAELRGSGDLEQDADNIIFMYRAKGEDDVWVHKDDKPKIRNWQKQGLEYIVLNIVKQRMGETGKTAVLFQPRTLQYASVPRETGE